MNEIDIPNESTSGLCTWSIDLSKTNPIVSSIDPSENSDILQQTEYAISSENVIQDLPNFHPHNDQTTKLIFPIDNHAMDDYELETLAQSLGDISLEPFTTKTVLAQGPSDYIIEDPLSTAQSSNLHYKTKGQNLRYQQVFKNGEENGRGSVAAGNHLFRNALHGALSNKSRNQTQPIRSQAPNSARRIDEFSEWMCSRCSEHSLWHNAQYRIALLKYLGRIYEQRHYVTELYNRLSKEMTKLDELDFLHELIEKTKERHATSVSISKWEDKSRIHQRVDDLKCIFEFSSKPSWSNSKFIVEPSNINQIIDKKSIGSYFDFGCGDGSITAAVGRYLGLSNDSIFGADVYECDHSDIKFIKLNENQADIQLQDNCIDLITSFVTFHHVSNIEQTSRELARILRPGGYLIIREHDCKTDYLLATKYLNFVHAIMMIAGVGEFANSARNDVERSQLNKAADWEEQKWYIIQYAKSIRYRTGKEWQVVLDNVGFRHRATLSYGKDGSSNPQHLFYAVYQLEKRVLDVHK
ncbi:unnamed protein product [Adineta ricciae]|uniref:Methyltransferase type 11 domain-containing protein n=1 Tax=Adineta ricciae TaxID=249248 RepID=A0A815YQL4_ADIRI|nr:unnamed protein product [Adineta ricciae]